MAVLNRILLGCIVAGLLARGEISLRTGQLETRVENAQAECEKSLRGTDAHEDSWWQDEERLALVLCSTTFSQSEEQDLPGLSGLVERAARSRAAWADTQEWLSPVCWLLVAIGS